MKAKTDPQFSKSKSLDQKAAALTKKPAISTTNPKMAPESQKSEVPSIRKSKSMELRKATSKGLEKPRGAKIQRYKRQEPSMTVAELEKKLLPYAMLDKRDPQELAAEIFDDNALHFQRLPDHSRKAKRNEKLSQLMPFKSNRLQTMVRCVREEECMAIDSKLKNVFHKGVLNEDIDTDESVQQKGVDRNYNNLKKALDQYKLRNRGSYRQKEQKIPASQLELKSRRHHLPELIGSTRTLSDHELNRPTKNIKRHSLLTDAANQSKASLDNKDTNSMEEEKNEGKSNMAEEKNRKKSKQRK